MCLTQNSSHTRDNTTAKCPSFRRFPSTNADSRRLPKKFRRLPKMSEDCQRCPKATENFRGEIRKFSKSRLNWLFLYMCVCVCVCVFHFSFSWKTLQITTGIFSGNMETVNINKLANLTVNTKTYGYITLGIKPHSDPQLMSLKNELPYMSVIILGEIFLFLDDFWWRIF